MSALGAATAADLTQICLDKARSMEDRASACSLLGSVGSRDSIFPLLEIGASASDDQTILIWESLKAVGALRSRRATRPLMRLIRTTPSLQKRQAAVYGLWGLTDQRAEGLLIRILLDKTENEKTRGFAAEALGLLHPTPHIEKAYIAALQDNSVEVRYSALCGLSGSRCKGALPFVKSLLSDDSMMNGEGTVAELAVVVMPQIEAGWGEGRV
jgi:HEAT repeat protein